MGLIGRAHTFLIYLGAIYAAGLLLLSFPSIQSHLIYLHKAKWPINAQFDTPHIYGLAPYKTINLNITTSDNERLGAWFVFSDPFFQSSSRVTRRRLSAPLDTSAISHSVKSRPSVLFFHGNAATRAAGYRVALYSAITTRLGANVLVIDYRGFADSTGSPSEVGLAKDGRAAWDWLVMRGAKAGDILILGHSLGTSVAALLAEELALEGINPRGVGLVSPFSSITTLAETYTIMGFLPLLRPLRSFPAVFEIFLKFLKHRFDTKSRLPTISAPVLLVHAKNDPTIPSSHSLALFNSLLEPFLSPLPPFAPGELAKFSEEKWAFLNAVTEKRSSERAAKLQHKTIPHFAKISTFERGKGQAKVIHAELETGGHTRLLGNEGLLDLIGDTFDIVRV